MGFFGNAGARIRNLLQWDKERVAINMAKGATASTAPQSGFDLLQSYGHDQISDYLKLEQDLLSKYVDLEEMDDYPETSTALNLFADDATTTDPLTNKVVWADSSDRTVKDVITDLFDVRLRLDEDAWPTARTLCKYGQVYSEALVTEDGLIGVLDLPPPTMRRIEGRRGELYGFIQDIKGRFGYSPTEFKQLLAVRGQAGDGVDSMTALEDWEVIHSRLRSKSRRSLYGSSVLDSSRWIWKRLAMLEDSSLMYRLERAPQRYAFYVDTGDMPPKEAFAYLNKIRQQYKKTKFINPQCLTGDTCVTLLDGTDRSMAELARDFSHKEFWVFSYDLCSGTIVPGKAREPRKTGEQVGVWRVVLDNGAVVRATSEHPFMMRDGTYKAASTLQRGDSLMPLYLSKGSEGSKGYWRYLDQSTGVRRDVHRMVADFIDGDIAPGMHVHHIDHNKENNTPENLEILTGSEHMARHPENHAAGRAAFVDRVKSDRDFALSVANRIFTWRKEQPEEFARLSSEHGKDIMKARIADIAPAHRCILDIIIDKLKSEPASSVVRLVDLLNQDCKFVELWSGLITTKLDKITAGTLQEFISRHGFSGLEDLKDQCGSNLLLIKMFDDIVSMIEEEVILDPVVVIEDVVLRLNARPEFVGCYTHATGGKYNKINLRLFKQFITDRGFEGFKDFKNKKIGACRYKQRNYSGVQLPGEPNNHKVVSVTFDGYEDVYNMEVDRYHNFALTSGVFVHNSGKADLKFNPLNNSEDFFIPVSRNSQGGTSNTKIDILNGPNYNSIQDIEYFRLKMFGAIGVPKAYLGFEESQGKGSASQSDVRFGKSVLRIQRELRDGYRKMARIHLAALNINPAAVDFEVYMTVPSSVFELAQLEVRNAKADFAGRMSQFVSMHWILNKVFGLSDTEIEYILKQRHDEQLADAEIQAKAAGMTLQTQGAVQMSQQQQMAASQVKSAPAQAENSREDQLQNLRSLSQIWPQRRQQYGYRPINEQELFNGNRDHEKMMEDNFDKMLKNNNGLARRMQELKDLVHELKLTRPR